MLERRQAKKLSPNMLLKGCLNKLKYSFQGSIQTDENYMPLLTLCVTL